MTAGITAANEGQGGISWDILGQTYWPKQHSVSSFAFDTLFPPGSFVPPHSHADQDEFIHVHASMFELLLDGQTCFAAAGDLVRLPMGIPHGIFNKSTAPVRALFWLAPANRAYEMFSRMNNVADPGEVIRIAAEYQVTFPPPPG